MDNLNSIECNICKQIGHINRKQKNWFNKPVVIIGWLIVIPSMLGVLFGILGSVISVGDKVKSRYTEYTAEKNYHEQLSKIGMTEQQFVNIMSSGLPVEQKVELLLSKAKGASTEQLQLVMAAGQDYYTGKQTEEKTFGVSNTIIQCIVWLIFIITSFMSGLLGYILVMKKKVLYCNNCKAIQSETV